MTFSANVVVRVFHIIRALKKRNNKKGKKKDDVVFVKVVVGLLDRGACAEAATLLGDSALHLSLAGAHWAVARALLAAWPEAARLANKRGATPAVRVKINH